MFMRLFCFTASILSLWILLGSTSPTNLSTIPYNLEAPNKKYKLPEKLTEISGLSYANGHLFCVQDEKGNFYKFNLQTEEITKYHFGKDGDYEGIEIVGDRAYILQSDGDIYESRLFKDGGENLVKKHETPLHQSNDTEGIGYNPYRKEFLISCKNKPTLDKQKYKGKRAIYTFDLESKILYKEPSFLLDLGHFRKARYTYRTNANKIEPLTKHAEEEVFMPSAVAMHPFNCDWYILSSVGKGLVIVNEESHFQRWISLSPDLFKQPEGICFDEDGNLYISNEGRNGKGNILKFKIR